MCYTGHLFEREVVGQCLALSDGSYVSYRQAEQMVLRSQPWDPSDPGTRVGNDLHAQIALALGIDDWSRLGLFTAIGSPLDQFHGVDAIIVLRTDRGCKKVTVDLTTNPTKGEYKATITIEPHQLESANMAETAAMIARLLV